jgi:hypothetical protein
MLVLHGDTDKTARLRRISTDKRATGKKIGDRIMLFITSGPLLRSINKAGKIWGHGFTPKVIWAIVKANAKSCGLPSVAPHDLRSYAESRIMPNRDSEMLSTQGESCG